MTSSPPATSLSLTGSRLKAQLDASRRPPHVHNVRRAVSSNITPRKKKKEQQQERPKTVAETRSTPRQERSPCRTAAAQSPSPEKCAAPTPPPSRSNSTKSPVPGDRLSSAKARGEGQPTMQPSSRSSPKRQTPSKLRLRDSLSPLKKLSPSPSSRSSPGVHGGGYADPWKTDDPRLRTRASPSKRTPPKLKLRRSTPMTDLASLGGSPSPKSPAKSSPAGTEPRAAQSSPSTRKTRKD